jgi:hypothetical protein
MKAFLNWFNTTFKGTWLYNFVQKLINSADNSKLGFSGKKATIIALTYCVLKMHDAWLHYALRQNDFSLFPIILGSDFSTILLLFGINEYGKKTNNPSGNSDNLQDTTQTVQ